MSCQSHSHFVKTKGLDKLDKTYWNGAAYMRRKWTCVFVLRMKPRAALKLLKQYRCPNTRAPKNDFSLPPFSLNLDSYSKLAF